jgi:hypothetical protein
MLPLIPAIILLLLHGPSSYDRIPQDSRTPESWSVLQRSASVRSSNSAALFRLLAIAVVQSQPGIGPAPEPELLLPTGIGSPIEGLKGPPVVEAYQDCRRSRDGPDSNA